MHWYRQYKKVFKFSMIALRHMQVLEVYQSTNELSQAVQDNCSSSKIKVMTAVINLQKCTCNGNSMHSLTLIDSTLLRAHLWVDLVSL